MAARLAVDALRAGKLRHGFSERNRMRPVNQVLAPRRRSHAERAVRRVFHEVDKGVRTHAARRNDPQVETFALQERASAGCSVS